MENPHNAAHFLLDTCTHTCTATSNNPQPTYRQHESSARLIKMETEKYP